MISATHRWVAFAITAGSEFENVRANVKTMAIEFDSAMKVVEARSTPCARPDQRPHRRGARTVAIMTVASNVAPMLAKAMHERAEAALPSRLRARGIGTALSTPDDPRLQAALNIKAETEAIAGYT